MLVDFPRNTTQAKALEKVFTGHETPTDKAKSATFENYEVWSKFADPKSSVPYGYNGTIQACPSIFDAVLLMNTEKEEVIRRASNRKIDPTTNTVYHMEDSPPPDDAKLVERLTDYFGPYESSEQMLEKVEASYSKFKTYHTLLGEYFADFGQYDASTARGLETLRALP